MLRYSRKVLKENLKHKYILFKGVTELFLASWYIKGKYFKRDSTKKSK